MFIDVITLRYDPSSGTLDARPLREVTRDRVVLGVRDHFFVVASVPHLALVLEYRLPEASAADDSSQRPGSPRGDERSRTDDLRATLDAPVRERFDLLRAWRAGVARDEAVPAYAILTNRQLSALAEACPSSRAGILGVPGLGRHKAERYSDAILKVLGTRQAAAPSHAQPAPAPLPPATPAPEPPR